jgi:hypothetical protein
VPSQVVSVTLVHTLASNFEVLPLNRGDKPASRNIYFLWADFRHSKLGQKFPITLDGVNKVICFQQKRLIKLFSEQKENCIFRFSFFVLLIARVNFARISLLGESRKIASQLW